MAKKDKRTPLQVRRAMALEIAEGLDLHFGFFPTQMREKWDVDEAAEIIDSGIPLTNVEAQMAYDEEVEEEKARGSKKPKGPSPFDKLREALGLTDKKVSIVQVIHAATERITYANQTAEEISKLLEELSGVPANKAHIDRALKIVHKALGRKDLS